VRDTDRISGRSVALLTPCFWPEVRRGSERFVRDLADGLIAGGDHPVLITSHPRRAIGTVEEGLPVRRHWRPPEGRLHRRGHQPHLLHLPSSYLSLRLGSFDVAHAVHPTDALVAARWSRATGRPSVVSYMGLPSHESLAGLRGRVDTVRRGARECSAAVALSQAAARAFVRLLGIKPRVIAPGVNTARFTPGDQRDVRPTLFCPAASGEPRKRVGDLVEAFGRLRRAVPGARLVLARPRMNEIREALDLEGDGVEVIDVDRAEDLLSAYRQAWVTVLPAVEEAFGLVLIESMACGTPVVGRADGAIPEIVDRPQVGRTFTGDQPTALTGALVEALELAQDPATALACRRRAEDYSMDRCVAAYRGLYAELLERA